MKSKELPLGRALGYLDLLIKRRSSSARVNMGKECSLKISWFLILFLNPVQVFETSTIAA